MSKNPAHQLIHFKLIHKAYATPNMLHRMKRLPTPLCTLCNSNIVGTYMHMFFDCPIVSTFWDKVFLMVSELCDRFIPTPSPSTVENQQHADNLNEFYCRFEKRTVTAVESFRFLGTTISQDLKWDNDIDSIVKKAKQRLYLLHKLRKFNLPQELLIQFYSAIIESVLCTSITVWFSSATKSDLRRLRRVVRTAERIIGITQPTLQELYLSRVNKRAIKITLDPSHPAHSLFELLPSGRWYRALSTRTTRHRNSFFPQAIHLIYTWQ